MLRTIRDPEKPSTLEDLKVVYADGIIIQPPTSDNVQVVCYQFIFYFFFNILWVAERKEVKEKEFKNVLFIYCFLFLINRFELNLIQQYHIVHWPH